MAKNRPSSESFTDRTLRSAIRRLCASGALLLLVTLLSASPLTAGDRPLCLYIIDLTGAAQEGVRDSIVARLLEEGCIVDSCGNRSVTYSLYVGLPAGVSEDLMRRALGGEKKAMKILLKAMNWDPGRSPDHFWSSDGIIVFEREGAASNIRITGIGDGSKPHRRGASNKAVVTRRARRPVTSQELDAMMKKLLEPMWARFRV